MSFMMRDEMSVFLQFLTKRSGFLSCGHGGAENGENRENNGPFFGKRGQERLRPKIQRNDEDSRNTLQHKRFSKRIKVPPR